MSDAGNILPKRREDKGNIARKERESDVLERREKDHRGDPIPNSGLPGQVVNDLPHNRPAPGAAASQPAASTASTASASKPKGNGGGSGNGDGGNNKGNGNGGGSGNKGGGGGGGNNDGGGDKKQKPLTKPQRSIYDFMSQTLKAWGLGMLIDDMRNYLVQGYGANEIQLRLQNTGAWKTRFAGNEVRKEKGLSVLSPADYIATEQAYRQALRAYGLPAGFYDQHSDFVNWIGNDVSPSEVSTRAQIAHDQYMAAPPEYKQMWAKYFGGKGSAIAAILDPKVATQVIQDEATQVAIGAEAKMQGFNVSKGRAQTIQEHGTTIQQAKAAFQRIGQVYPIDQQIAHRFGTHFSLNDEENDLLLGNGSAAQERATLYAEEQGLFNGHSAADSNTVGVSQSSY